MSKKGKAQRVKDTAICYNNIAKILQKYYTILLTFHVKYYILLDEKNIKIGGKKIGNRWYNCRLRHRDF